MVQSTQLPRFRSRARSLGSLGLKSLCELQWLDSSPVDVKVFVQDGSVVQAATIMLRRAQTRRTANEVEGIFVELLDDIEDCDAVRTWDRDSTSVSLYST